MKKERWLNNIIFDTELIDHSYLSETERYSLKSFLLDNKTLAQIGKEIETSDERARQIIKNAIGKILLNTNNLIAKSFWLQKTLKEKDQLQNELKDIKLKFKKELASEKQLTILFEEIDLPITNISFIVRAKNLLMDLKVNTVGQLATLTKNKLFLMKIAGIKTDDEIIKKVEEFIRQLYHFSKIQPKVFLWQPTQLFITKN